MSLQLDARQRAMLAEMGLKLFVAEAPAAGADADAVAPARPAQRKPALAISRQAAPELIAANAHPAGAIDRFDAKVPVEGALRLRQAEIETMAWDTMAQAVAGCRACKLCESRRNTVFGVGQPAQGTGLAPQTDWLIVGEAPGENEDLQGEPFVGQAGKLLDNMLRALQLDRQHNVFITNVLKCRPPGNRNPEPQEVAQCEPFLRRQVALLQPKIILAMGRFAVQALLQSTEPIGKLRGRPHQYAGVPVVVTYHPAYLLRNLPDTAKAWADLCLAVELLEA